MMSGLHHSNVDNLNFDSQTSFLTVPSHSAASLLIPPLTTSPVLWRPPSYQLDSSLPPFLPRCPPPLPPTAKLSFTFILHIPAPNALPTQRGFHLPGFNLNREALGFKTVIFISHKTVAKHSPTLIL